MGRPKGFIPSPESLAKAKETKIKNREAKIAFLNNKEKPILIISRKWKTGFDFWESMRNILRPLHRYVDCKNIERIIVQKDIWENREEILKILENYFILQLKKLKSECIID